MLCIYDNYSSFYQRHNCFRVITPPCSPPATRGQECWWRTNTIGPVFAQWMLHTHIHLWRAHLQDISVKISTFKKTHIFLFLCKGKESLHHSFLFQAEPGSDKMVQYLKGFLESLTCPSAS